MVYEGLLKLYWGLKKPITLSPGVMGNRHRQSVRGSIVDYIHVDDDAYGAMIAEAESEKQKREHEPSGNKLHDIVSAGWDSKGEHMAGVGVVRDRGYPCNSLHNDSYVCFNCSMC